MSCKKPVGRLREVVQIPKKVSLMKLMLFFCEIFVLCCFIDDIVEAVFSFMFMFLS